VHKVCINGKLHMAAEAETVVWNLVSGSLRVPERLRAGLDEMIEQECAGVRGNPDQEATSWLEKLSEVEQERSGYLRLAAKGQMADEALAGLEGIRMMAEELAAIQGQKEILEDLEWDRKVLLECLSDQLVGGLRTPKPTG
jgi:hypothetical protein